MLCLQCFYIQYPSNSVLAEFLDKKFVVKRKVRPFHKSGALETSLLGPDTVHFLGTEPLALSSATYQPLKLKGFIYILNTSFLCVLIICSKCEMPQ